MHAFREMPSPRLGILTLFVALFGCESAPAGTVIGIMQADSDGGPDVLVPAANCAGLDECACSQTPGCVPVTTDCWCPPAACGSTTACTCQGGRFLGCNPAGATCGSSQCGLLAQPSPPDDNGCIRCVDPAGCAPAITALASACSALSEASTQWLCGAGQDDCSAFCLGALRTCESAVCALCLDCDCTNDLFDSCVNECESSAQNRH